MSEDTDIKYEVLEVADVIAHASDDLGILVLKTDKGRIGLHMKRAVLDRLTHELRRASSRGTKPSRP